MKLSPSRILVTGACGSIGSELVMRLLKDGHTVCAFDQSENGLFELDQKLNAGIGEKLRSFLGNIRDEDRLKRAMEGVDIVFHCAALKHVYLSEYNPFEAMQTNIMGTNNVILAALGAGVDRVVFTSSDKAVNPTSTMGATKLLGERLVIAANHSVGSHNTKFSCVRFGNVLNTNGSVLQIFKQQLENDLPLTITSKGMTRFFISMEQAIGLCLHAAESMFGGEIFVQSMGCCDILALAKAINKNRLFEYVEIGHKPGEKLYEELVTETEAPRTIAKDQTYIILPDTVNMMSEDLQNDYKAYDALPRLSSSLRSDVDMLTKEKLASMLDSAKLLD